MKVLLSVPISGDATSWYRAEGPLLTLGKANPDFKWDYVFRKTWPELAKYDILFLQRPACEQDLSALQMAHTLGLKVVCDYDDDLLSVELDSPAYVTYKNSKAEKWVPMLVKGADLVTVSTPAIAASYGKGIVIPNAHNDQILPIANRQAPSDSKVIMWRGSEFHQASLLDKAKDITELIAENPDWTWYFLGHLPFFIAENVPKGSKVYHIPSLDILDYYQVLKKIKPSIHIVTLRDTKFNNAKSNCAYLETEYAGAAVVAPDMCEWQQQGITTYKPGRFKAEVENLMKAPQQFRTNLSNIGWDFIKRELLLSDMNKKRLELLQGLLK